jgi:hypothetical protein
VNQIIISKTDVLDDVNIFKLIHNNILFGFESLAKMKEFINKKIMIECKFDCNDENNIKSKKKIKIIYSNDLENIDELIVEN